MRPISEEKSQSSSIHQRIRKASFVQFETGNTEKFKYNLGLKGNRYAKKKFIALKTVCNKIIQGTQLQLHKVAFKEMRNQGLLWFTEALVEGFVMNFIVWSLIKMPFNLFTMIGWGFAVKTFLGIYWRLKKDGSTSTIPTHNK